MVGAAGGQLLDVGGEQDPGDVFLVSAEVRHGDKLCAIKGLEEVPNKDVALGC